jgi:hypothetical protein
MQTLIHHFDTPASTQNWHPINDGVMGGASSSQMRFDVAGHAAFEGVVSLKTMAALPRCVPPLTWDARTQWPIC